MFVREFNRKPLIQFLTYSETIQFLYDLRLFGLKFGLETTRLLADFMGRPQDGLRFIHVAGTNGKGSTCAMLESIYRAAGLRVGLYTSPHLISFAERIQVNRKLIAETEVVQLVEQLRLAPGFDSVSAHPTFFEAVTVMALCYFAKQKCDLIIWETGLGGRLDATNIVQPMASVITNVQLDHQQWLGETLPEIAQEKAGIIKPGIPIITAAEEPAALRVIQSTAQERSAPLSILTQDEVNKVAHYSIGLAGKHQRINAALAMRTVNVLQSYFPVSAEAIRSGLKNTIWPGRRQRLRQRPGQIIVLDGAHNPAGALTLIDVAQEEFDGHAPALILGMMRDKECAALCQILAPLSPRIFLTAIASDRTADPRQLAKWCEKSNSTAKIFVCDNIADALAQTLAEPYVLLTGSLYFVGEALELLQGGAASDERALNDYGAAR